MSTPAKMWCAALVMIRPIAENTSIVVGSAIDWPTICSR
jgi:hypothetical protein